VISAIVELINKSPGLCLGLPDSVNLSHNKYFSVADFKSAVLKLPVMELLTDIALFGRKNQISKNYLIVHFLQV
jgi:hypothetical protein